METKVNTETPDTQEQELDLYNLMFHKFRAIKESRAHFALQNKKLRLLSHPIDGLRFKDVQSLKAELERIKNKTSKLSRVQRDFLSALPNAVISDILAEQSKAKDSANEKPE